MLYRSHAWRQRRARRLMGIRGGGGRRTGICVGELGVGKVFLEVAYHGVDDGAAKNDANYDASSGKDNA